MTLQPGDPVPWFTLPSADAPRYAIHSAAGRYVLLGFLGSAARPETAAALAALRADRGRFDGETACFLGISVDAADRAEARLAPEPPGIRFLFDLDGAASRACGVLRDDPRRHGVAVFRSCWMLLDPMLRVIETRPLAEAEAILACLAALPPPAAHAGFEAPAPVLILPRVFEPEFCRALITHHEAQCAAASDVVRAVDGRAAGAPAPPSGRGRDRVIGDAALREGARARILRRVVPELRKAHHFEATRMEDYVVACHDPAEDGHAAPHRDNATAGAAHRRFAVTIELNAEEFEGGALRFPEYGARCWRAPTGGALVFSCSLLHEALPVTAGRRYAFLPFLYDEAAARLRQATAARPAGAAGAGRALAAPAAR